MTTEKYFDTKEQFIAFRNAWAKAAQAGKITAAHMLMYNAIRGKDIYHGFTPVTNKNKLGNGMPLNQGLRAAHEHYRTVLRMAAMYADRDWGKSWVDNFIEPFEGALTADDLQRIDVPEKIDVLWADYGQGLRLKEKILEGAKPATFDELFALDVEDAA